MDMTDDIDEILGSIAEGDEEGLERLFVALYQDLHTRARAQMGGLQGHTLQPTALVNEAFVRIQKAGGPWKDKTHFLVAASKAMRHVLVDHFRHKSSAKREGKRADVEIDLVADSFQ